MYINLDLNFYWVAVGAILVALAGQWGFRRVKSLFGR
jgi:hypothetical protein